MNKATLRELEEFLIQAHQGIPEKFEEYGDYFYKLSIKILDEYQVRKRK